MKRIAKKDTIHIIEKHPVFQASLITDLIQKFVKGSLLSGPTILQQDYHVTNEGVIPAFCRQSLLEKKSREDKISTTGGS